MTDAQKIRFLMEKRGYQLRGGVLYKQCSAVGEFEYKIVYLDRLDMLCKMDCIGRITDYSTIMWNGIPCEMTVEELPFTTVVSM
jgi:hypothetical protein